jgi:hypothetical protein
MQLDEWVAAQKINDEVMWEAIVKWQISCYRRVSEVFRIDEPTVVSTHYEKSIVLPVVRYEFDDVVMTVRHNVHDWRVSVDSVRPVELWCWDFLLPETQVEFDRRCFDGFNEGWVFAPYHPETNAHRFSAVLGFGELVLLAVQLCGGKRSGERAAAVAPSLQAVREASVQAVREVGVLAEGLKKSLRGVREHLDKIDVGNSAVAELL